MLLIIVFLMSCFLITGVALKLGADHEADNLRKSLGSSFILKANTDDDANLKTVERNGYSYITYDGPSVTDGLIDQILGIDGITDYFINLEGVFWTPLELRPGEWADSYEYALKNPDSDDVISLEEYEMWRKQPLVYFCTNGIYHPFFRNGALSISEGRNIQGYDSFKAVISKYLAEKNGLSIGDAFPMEMKERMFIGGTDEPDKLWGDPMELEIVGFFDIHFEQEPSPFTFESQYAENFIFTDSATMRQYDQNINESVTKDDSLYNPEPTYNKVTFFVEDPQMLDDAMEQVRKLDLNWYYFTLMPDDEAYKASVKPLEQIGTFSSLLIAISVIGCMAILYLVLNMWVKGRKQEIGVLISIGISKRQVVLQLLLECLIVSVIGFLLALVVSGPLIETFGRLAEGMTAPQAGAQSYAVNY